MDDRIRRHAEVLVDQCAEVEFGDMVRVTAPPVAEDLVVAVYERLGELGIGMNRGIDRFTYNMLFDEKMGDTVHMALGRAYDENVGEDCEQNDSAIHVDLITDVS